MNHQALHTAYSNAIASRVRALRLPDPSGQHYLFASSEDPKKVGTAVHKGTLASAFTRGCFTLSDNFDFVEGRTKPVENCTFGAAKQFLERQGAAAFLTPAWTEAAVRARLGDFAAVDGLKLDAALADSSLYYTELLAAPHDPDTRRTFLARLMWRQLAAVDATVFTWAAKKKIGLEDPIVALCTARKSTLAVLREALAGIDDYARVSAAYFGVREALLPVLLDANPRFAKLAVGRKVIFPLVDDAWMGKGGRVDLSHWTVAMARAAQLARHPELAYAFGMAQAAGLHTETSDCDDLWAVQVAVADKSGPLDRLLTATVDEAEAFWADVAAKTPTRKLGLANALAARMLTGSMTEAERADAVRARTELDACGWSAWFEANVAPLTTELADDELKAALVAADVGAFWEALSC